MNTVALVGRLTQDVDLRYTQQGTANGKTTLAVRRRMPNSQTGEYESDFIRLVAWGKTAEVLADYTQKGSQVGITGRIQTGSYENQQGQKVYTTDVVVESITFLETKENTQSRKQQNDDFEITDDDLPF